MYGWVGVGGAEGNLGYHYKPLRSYTGWQGRKLQESSCLSLASAGSISMYVHTGFLCGCWGPKIHILMLPPLNLPPSPSRPPNISHSHSSLWMNRPVDNFEQGHDDSQYPGLLWLCRAQGKGKCEPAQGIGVGSCRCQLLRREVLTCPDLCLSCLKMWTMKWPSEKATRPLDHAAAVVHKSAPRLFACDGRGMVGERECG